ncbi:MAG: SDR family oxidoreductase [Akkermansiaceae bacterium]|nr:SDR family oxidoreductase [Akkermansiaceae bacterium]
MVTGASSGLGAEFARQLAPECEAMILVARRGDLLKQLASELDLSSPGTEVHCVPTDLTHVGDREGLFKMLEAMAFTPDLLVNNAGMGDYGEFSSSSWRKVDSMMQVNMVALTHLTHGFLPGMIAGGGGDILNVSSLASILPIPDFAVYAATKAYVTSFSEALRIELRSHGINVLALCPGPVHTAFGSVAQRGGHANVTPGGEMVYVSSEQVVAEGISALQRGKARHYPGLKVAVAAAAIGLLPIAALRLIMGRRPRKGL